ncbi:hypothetical protein GK091_24305 [Spirosoma agri]|uniref:Uncharacterized protein n=1 Tax=Spirosoma agri TaxID=1987381 RepID=A0A6M0IRB7_9BACT|nr:hypothetical protein [Spirosoma agri]NEU70025.1 hypothetical protein [Spirosoma agri]
MKKVTLLILLILGVTVNSYSQAPAPHDSFAGKWKAALPVSPDVGPRGEVQEATLWIDIVRKEGKLTIHLGSEKIINARVQEERANELFILFDTAINPGFATQQITARDVPMTLIKVDDDNLQVDFMGSQVTAKRAK